MKTIKPYVVVSFLPRRIQGLRNVAHNMWWSWNPEAIDLFRRLDREMWEETNHNPVLMLARMQQEKLIQASKDSSFCAHLDRVLKALNEYTHDVTWFQKAHSELGDMQIAYFSMEYGINETLPIYSGGLGILAGDHVKSASDLGLPLVAVGMLYSVGYFRQSLNSDGWQQEVYPENDFYNMPIALEHGEDGKPLKISVEFPGRNVYAQVWRCQVGRISLYLLDANLPENNQEDRRITAKLYGGDKEMRIKQEVLLGIGGVRALKALGVEPSVFHMNEGHSAFLALERARNLMQEKNISYTAARKVVAASTVFTTHTPVPAGNDVFPRSMLTPYFDNYVGKLGMSMNDLIALGRKKPADSKEDFCMTVLALRFAHCVNGVSELHGKVSRSMWQEVWNELPLNEVPITSITNGVHVRSWISYDMAGLYDRYLGPAWVENPADLTIWDGVDNIPDAELWRTHERRRERLVAVARQRLKKQLIRRGALPNEIAVADEVLDPEVLTIGFARRFATYKRATLLLRDPERLKRMLLDPKRPIQIILAGKAHPQDAPGKDLISQIVNFSRQPEIRRRFVFLEDYDMNLARYMVGGVDVWMNTPRRPLEACGTSGMKVTPNGGMNFSILDGWWCEGYDGNNGWAIGAGEEYADQDYQDDVESRDLYTTLEREIIPLFYDVGTDKLPRGWAKRMKTAMKSLGPVFNTNRMVMDYLDKFYIKGHNSCAKLMATDFDVAKKFAEWEEKVQNNWSKVHVVKVDQDEKPGWVVSEIIPVRAIIAIDGLTPDDIQVEIYYGVLDSDGNLPEGETVMMSHYEDMGNGAHIFSGELPCLTSGLHGYSIRIFPKHNLLCNKYETGLITWG